MIKQQHRRRSSRIEHTEKPTWRCWECAAQPHLLCCCWWVKSVEWKLFKKTNCLEPFQISIWQVFRLILSLWNKCWQLWKKTPLAFRLVPYKLPFTFCLPPTVIESGWQPFTSPFKTKLMNTLTFCPVCWSSPLWGKHKHSSCLCDSGAKVVLGNATGFYFNFTKSNILSHKHWSKLMYNCAENVLMALSELRNKFKLWHCSCDNLKPTVHLRKLIALNILSFINTI